MSNYQECARCKHLIDCKNKKFKAKLCLWFEERKEDGREKNVRKVDSVE